ncbi:MAG TPA: hypothetical protein GX707_00460 [Epulopiscium sp.]|nr:hypothetical protein [Candidatus Epulonipiscium sp.]
MGIFDFLKKKTKVEQPLFYNIVCPYCFNKFQPEEVVFRATHIQEDDGYYSAQEDEKLNRYRERLDLDELDEMEAVIEPYTIPTDKHIYSGHVLVGIVDAYGYTTKKRLCPHCHNILPITSGKSPSNIIAIVGASQVGKSVYMTSLIHTLQNTTAANFDAACIPINSEISRKFKQDYEEPLFERGDLLTSTRKEGKQEPFIFQFKFKDDGINPLTLVFFDIAGEGMVDQEYLDMYAAHIKNSSGMLFLVDPLQIKTIRDKIHIKRDDTIGEFASQHDEPREVIINLFENFIGYEDNGKTKIPTAIVLTKSDMLHFLKEEDSEYIRPNSNIFNQSNHKNYFSLTEFNNINGEVKRFVEKVDRPFKDAVDVHFSDSAYFATSALGRNPIDMQIDGIIDPIRVDEPFLWLLYKLNYIEGRED